MLDPQVLALDQNESMEIDQSLQKQRDARRDPLHANRQFLQSLTAVSAKIDTFQSRRSRQSSYQRYQESALTSAQKAHQRDLLDQMSRQEGSVLSKRSRAPSHDQRANIVTGTQFSQQHDVELRHRRISDERRAFREKRRRVESKQYRAGFQPPKSRNTRSASHLSGGSNDSIFKKSAKRTRSGASS